MILTGPSQSGRGRLRHARVCKVDWTGVVHLELCIDGDQQRTRRLLKLIMTANEWNQLSAMVEACRSDPHACQPRASRK